MNLTERPLCKMVPSRPQARCSLLPVGLELWFYVQTMRNLQKRRMEASCLELALEGERLCKAGDFKAGAAFFEAAVQVGTEDLKTLSAIYSQLGNAYFYLKEYSKALEYHKHDLTLARTIGDRIGEAKASGNLGNTLKILGQFDEAVVCCQRHLDISQEQGDKVGEARALYNIGNVYHAKGKHLSWNMAQDPGYVPQEVKETLQKASEYYERNLSLVKELGDRAAQGRAYGNLGNTHYLLGNFSEAIAFHKERLAIAKEFGDKAAERRAYSNLGNAHIFLGRFDISAEYYKKTLQLSRQLKDQAVEAQACYSLGNTYTLLQDYERAIEYHLKHLVIAQELGDRVGEGRACWSLGNAYVSLGSHEQALHFARKHLEISQEIGDRNGELTAQVNMAQLRSALGLGPGDEDVGTAHHYSGYEAQGARPKRLQRNSMDSLDLLKFPSEKKINRTPSDEECFFDLLSKFQSNRMDDQRCPLEECPSEAAEAAATPVPALGERISQSSLMASPQTEEFFDLIASSQSRRLDDQRANVGNLPGLRITHNNLGHLRVEGDAQEPGDEFFNMLMKCQSSRIDDQRCAPPDSIPRGPTMPDEDFFSLIQRVQAKRMDEQRVDLASAQEEAAEEPQRPGSS
ncbi:G-protein-signaling modulator 1 isoform X3 [Falco biarmicus]|uniref:G-protein-signaling modulator 1 isoform X3 n=1 Tax=Falco rusticolus TaxID=120794 RepID=UPI001886969F|nr:G-protein-signaling modulator 1 isoform X3 [Falco rusticolus]XP_055575825.1 G-protein-signaling modulator 1 isoform X3 [Falco cherrug]XP_056207067.1 G-protein-signaling modulator 1 isoform X3 [Falco biarmicus]